MPPPPRSASTISVSSQNTVPVSSQKTGKGPPPVARKPAHLLSTSPTGLDLETSPSTETKAKPIPPRRPSSSVQNVSRAAIRDSLHRTASARETNRTHEQPPMPPPRRAGTASVASGTPSWAPPGAVGLVGLSKEGRPTVPPRKPVGSGTPSPTSSSGRSPPIPAPKKPALNARSPVVDLLGDDGAAVGGWEALKPS